MRSSAKKEKVTFKATKKVSKPVRVSFTINSMDVEKQDGHLLVTCPQSVSSSTSHSPSDSSMKLHLM